MIDAGDIHLADLGDERRRRVLVVSNARFHRASDRAIVAPAIDSDADEVPFPWHIRVDHDVFAVDLIRSVPLRRLLERTGRASAATTMAARRAVLQITG